MPAQIANVISPASRRKMHPGRNIVMSNVPKNTKVTLARGDMSADELPLYAEVELVGSAGIESVAVGMMHEAALEL